MAISIEALLPLHICSLPGDHRRSVDVNKYENSHLWSDAHNIRVN